VARLIQRLVEPAHPCSYLPTESARLEVRLMIDVSPAEWQAMLERGWRRFGPVYFRPLCSACGECVTLRVLAGDYSPSRNQRRALHRAARFRRVVSTPIVDDERVALHARWHEERQRARGWPPSAMDAEHYFHDFAFPHAAAREAAFYDDAQGGRLVGVGLFDETPAALSAVYFFHDPDLERESLGTANVALLLDDARRLGKAHVYLGYRVAGCDSLRYKANFLPHELLVGRPAAGEAPAWIAGQRL
jgi:arginine-tRNA-protein transferase